MNYILNNVSYFKQQWQDKDSQVIAKLNDYILAFSLQGGPGSSGAKGESGDPGPQVKKQFLSLILF